MILAPTLTLSAGSGAAIVRPTFSRDFAGEKTLNNGTGPAITFTRASNATFFDASGVLQTAGNDQPRFDHSSTGSSLGLLIEESRTNLFTRSEQFDVVWGLGGNLAVTANNSQSPDGTNSADLLYPSVNSVAAQASQNPTVSANTTYTFSAFLKASGKTHAYLQVNTPITPVRAFFVTFNLSNGTAGTVQNLIGTTTGTTIAITSVGNGWYRASVTFVTDATTAEARVFIGPCDAANGRDVTASGTSGILAWGAQLEAGAFPTSYIPTTTAAATRSADSAVVTPISSFYNQSEGTLFAEGSFNAPNSHTTSQLAAEFNNTDDNRFRIGRLQPNAFPVLTNTVATVIDANIAGSSAIAQFLAAKIIGTYKVNDFALYANGSSIGTDTSATPITATHFRIGSGTTFNGFIANGHIRKIAYYPRRLSNTLLQQITT